VYYHDNWGFDVSFETQEARELADFLSNFDPSRDGLWVASGNGSLAGSVAIDGRQSLTGGARLRWFIVAPRFQGQGVGTALIRKARDFCREVGHRSVFLWTFQGLEAARRIYEAHGFVLSQQYSVQQWGRTIVEQQYVARW
jgi:GNAT superfamily N-acetyltransferase